MIFSTAERAKSRYSQAEITQSQPNVKNIKLNKFQQKATLKRTHLIQRSTEGKKVK